MKVAELEGALLDYWVAKAAGMPVDEQDQRAPYALGVVTPDRGVVPFSPSKDWSLAGPIIEREEICIGLYNSAGGEWFASPKAWMSHDLVVREIFMVATTPLIAAMRAFVASKFGYEVDIAA